MIRVFSSNILLFYFILLFNIFQKQPTKEKPSKSKRSEAATPDPETDKKSLSNNAPDCKSPVSGVNSPGDKSKKKVDYVYDYVLICLSFTASLSFIISDFVYFEYRVKRIMHHLVERERTFYKLKVMPNAKENMVRIVHQENLILNHYWTRWMRQVLLQT